MSEIVSGGDWTSNEIEATVQSYLSMLRRELSGIGYVKTAENEEVRKVVTARSKGSIEFKHQNISAVLIELGRIPIRGYKPRANYQGALFDAVAGALKDRPDLDQLMSQVAAAEAPLPSIGPIDLVLPPVMMIDASRWTPRTEGVHRNYLQRAERSAALGLAGELAVLDYEERRLREKGLERLALRIEHVAKTKGDGLGFDIRSFDDDGSDRLIEVKTTRYAAEVPFTLTRTELVASQNQPDDYYLYRLHNFGAAPKMYTLHGALSDTCTLEPSEFVAAPRRG